MSRITLTTILAFLLVSLSANGFAQTLPAAEPESVGLSTDRLSRVDALFESYIADGRMAVSLSRSQGKEGWHISAPWVGWTWRKISQ